MPGESNQPRRWRRKRLGENLYLRTDDAGVVIFEAHFRDVDGRQRCRKLAATSERAARRELRTILAARDGGERIVAASATLNELAEREFFPHLDSLAKAGRRSQRGVQKDRDSWRLYVRDGLGQRKLTAVEASHVAELIRSMRKRKSTRGKGEVLSESTIASTLNVLRAFYRLAIARGYVTRSPLTGLDRGELPRPRPPADLRILDEKELVILVGHAAEGYRAVVTLLAYSGLRISEALALRWRDVDFVEGELHVRGQLTRATRREPARLVPPKTRAGLRTVPMFPAVSTALAKHKEAMEQEGRAGECDFIFSTRTGRPLSQKNVAERGVARAAEKAGLGHVAPHDLRRSACSLAARRGVDPVAAAAMTGHSVAVWASHYTRSFGKPQRDEAREQLLAHGFGADIALTQDAAEPGELDSVDAEACDFQPDLGVERTGIEPVTSGLQSRRSPS
jgi:integrase